MTVTIIVDGKVWFQDEEVADLTLFDGFLTVCDKEGREFAVNILCVDSLTVTNY